MVTVPTEGAGASPHDAREMAESFGVDPERYDRARPRYPQALVDRIVAASPGRDLLDVGIGTGISAAGFRSAGWRVLGVDPDDRMAAFARRQGFAVEVATFEDWEPAGRSFDLITAGQAWHWVDPVAGAAKASQVLRPGGRLAVFWNAMEMPPAIAEAFGRAFRRAVPAAPFPRRGAGGLTGYAAFFARAADGMRETGVFEEPEHWQEDWERTYTRAEWLDAVPTGGGFTGVPAASVGGLLADLGAAIDAVGGSFTMSYATVAVTAVTAA